MKFYTDYPISILGDKAGEIAPIRQIEPLTFDGDKYVSFMVVGTGVIYECKAGYIYNKPIRIEDLDLDDAKITMSEIWTLPYD